MSGESFCSNPTCSPECMFHMFNHSDLFLCLNHPYVTKPNIKTGDHQLNIFSGQDLFFCGQVQPQNEYCSAG